MSKTKWTDERIIAEAEAIVADYPFDHAMRRHTIGTMTQVRNDMQSQIDALRLKNETLQHQLDELAKLAIRPQAQGEWEPVEDSEIDDLTYVEDRVLFAETEIGTMRIDFPDGYGVCRRTEPMWLDAPDSEGEWAWKSENGKWIGFVKNTQWGMSYRAITNIANYVYEFLVEEMPMGKWQRLHIHWPEASE